MQRPPPHRWLGPGALAVYCLSCVTMASMSLAALAAVLGVGGARFLPTPLDGLLNAWGLPLLLVSLAALVWTMRRSSGVALGLVAFGGLLTVAGMLAMGPGSSLQSENPHAPHLATPASVLPLALLFLAGAGLLLAGYVWDWRTLRRSAPGG